SGSASPSPGATGSPSPSPTPAATTPPATTSPSPAAAAPTGSASPGATGPSLAERQQAIFNKIGADAANTATGITDPKPVDQATINKLESFRTLTPEEVALLPATVQFNVPQITCDMLNKRPTGSIVDPGVQAVACETDNHTKYLMDKAKVLGTDLSGAQAN